jgi:transcriptional regulator with XRE-family HTH domain
MLASAFLVQALRRELKAADISYVELARRLRVSHATVKRMLTNRHFTLQRLDQILKVTGIEWARLVQGVPTENHLLDQLDWDQEMELASDETLMLVALVAMNHLSLAEIVAVYRLTEAQALRALLRLDRMGFLQLLPGNRIRMKVARTFAWIPNGPIQRFFRAHVADFFESDFAAANERLVVLSGMLTPGSAQRLLARLAEVTEEFVRHHHADASAPFAQRELLTLLVAARPWEMGFMRELRRAPSSAPAARTVVRSGKKLRS